MHRDEAEYAADCVTREPADNCEGCTEAIKAFQRSKKHLRALAKPAKTSNILAVSEVNINFVLFSTFQIKIPRRSPHGQ